VAAAYDWIDGASGTLDTYLRAVGMSVTGFCIVATVPIAAKWLLIGRWKEAEIQIWSLAYLRFWIVKTLTRANPCALLFVGSPLYVLYLRALGAKVGPGAVIFSRRVPICTDLLTIGAGSIIRRETLFLGYRAHAGRIETGPVTLGRNVLVGEKSVLDIKTSMGDDAQLGHASSLQPGQSVPAGQRWHGSPGQPTEVDYMRVPPARCSRLRRIGFCVETLLAVFLVYLPLVEGGVDVLVRHAAGRPVVVQALVVSFVVFGGVVLGGLLLTIIVPRVLGRLLEPGKVYPLYGFHDRIRRAIVRLGTIKFFPRLFGDSSYVVHYLRAIGYQLTPVDQTGSNFGIVVLQAHPALCSVGTGTMAADGLSILNDELSSTSFRLAPGRIGRHNFVGNDVVYPAGGRTGENCLLATKAMIPLDGDLHENTGLLGSPPFRIPRSVERDGRFDHLATGDEFRRRLRAKNRHNLRTIAIFLFTRWFSVFLVMALTFAAFELYDAAGHVVMALLFALSLIINPIFFALVERCIERFRRLEPKYCSIYDPYFWRHERLWKVPAVEYLRVFDGTPFKPLAWRMMGVRIGKRVFDDGVHIAERTLTTIGDDCVLNSHCKIQCHSQEDGVFKSDHTTLGAGCTVGVGAFVLYGVTMGDGAVLAADSFLMKGEEIPAHARWGGNPAQEVGA
jgi:non-ribosomal peptide synthetase-like protein